MPAVEVREEKEKCNRLLEVFDDVHAFLSDQVIRSIPESIEVFFRDNGVPGKLSEDVSDACLRYMIHGSFVDILAARKILQEHLLQQDAVDLPVQQVAEADEVVLSEAFQDHYVDVASHEVIGANVIEDCPELAAEEDAFCSPNETTLLVNVVAESGTCSEFCSSDLQHTFDQIEAVASEVGDASLEKEPQCRLRGRRLHTIPCRAKCAEFIRHEQESAQSSCELVHEMLGKSDGRHAFELEAPSSARNVGALEILPRLTKFTFAD